MNNQLMRKGREGKRAEYASNAGGFGFLNKLVVIGAATGVAMLSFRVARLVAAGLLLGLKKPGQKRTQER